jgi:hypothetical protein
MTGLIGFGIVNDEMNTGMDERRLYVSSSEIVDRARTSGT